MTVCRTKDNNEEYEVKYYFLINGLQSENYTLTLYGRDKADHDCDDPMHWPDYF
jgi:hypothetical protein